MKLGNGPPAEPADRGYDVEGWETIAEVSDLRVIVLTLAAGQCVPWHLHSEITDTFFCLDGPMLVQHPEGREVELVPGERHVVPPGTPHRVSGKAGGRCRFAIVQGIGRYDFIPVDIG